MNIQQITDLVEQSRADGNDSLTTAYLIIAELQQETAELRAVVDPLIEADRLQHLIEALIAESDAGSDEDGERIHSLIIGQTAANAAVNAALAKLTPKPEETEDVSRPD